MQTSFAVAACGVLGVLARFGIGELVAASAVLTAWPYTTLAINALGSLAIGVVHVAATEKLLLPEPLRLAIMVGFLGGFTTFSAFSLEVVRLAERGRFAAAAVYGIASPVLGIALAFAGIVGARRVF